MAPSAQHPSDYYAVLGVARTATDAELRRAYREQALRHHPDKNPECVAQATEKFKLVAEAFSVLKDSRTRAAYDQDSSSFRPSTFTAEKAKDLFSDVFGAELAATLGRAARGLVSAPGAVLGTAAQVFSDLPGVRGAVAAGYESMVSDAELRLDLEVRRLALLDERLDVAWCQLNDHDEESASSRLRREDGARRGKQEVWSQSRRCLGAIAACVLAYYVQVIYDIFNRWQAGLLLISLFPCCGYAIFHTVAACRRLQHLFQSQADLAAAASIKRSELQRGLMEAQEAFEAQRHFAADARQDLARLRGTATEAANNGPSLSHAFAVSSHVVGSVVGSVFGRRGSKEADELNSAARLT